MAFRVTLFFVALMLSGCAADVSLRKFPVLISGTVSNPKWTEWAFDNYGFGQPVPMGLRVVSADCLAHGGELYRAKVRDARDQNGALLGSPIDVAFPAHALRSDYSQRHYMLLQRSPDDFMHATGIRYLVTVWGNFDPERVCFVEVGHGHGDRRLCSDWAFHQKNAGRCVSVPDYLLHYAPATNLGVGHHE